MRLNGTSFGYLKRGFKKFARDIKTALTQIGHPEHSSGKSVTSSGLFAFASTVVKFVGDKYHDDPQGQLDICIRFLGGHEAPGAVNPLHALDLLYRQILSKVPNDILPTTMRILGLSVLYSDTQLPAQYQANFLLNRSIFYRSLQQLHSVIDIPPANDASHRSLHFYHTSFGDYLVDPRRSGTFSINRPVVYYDVAIHSLKWHGGSMISAETKNSKASNSLLLLLIISGFVLQEAAYSTSCPKLEWASSSQKQDIFANVKEFAWRMGWKTCSQVSDADSPGIVATLEDFDFRGMTRDPPGFAKFLAWLYKLVRPTYYPLETCDLITW